MNWYELYREGQDKGGTSDIQFKEYFLDAGVPFVVFKIRDKNYSYQLSFPEWARKVSYMARYSPGKALNWAKEHATKTYEVTDEYPGFGTIIREVE